MTPLRFHELWRNLELRDEDGRPLEEGKAPAALLHDVPLERRTCPYVGGRHLHAHPMNTSALRQVRDHWPQILGGIHRVRSALLAGRATAPAGLDWIWELSGVLSVLPTFLAFRGGSPLGGAVPALVSALYKVVVGIHHFAAELRLTSLAQGKAWTGRALEPACLHAELERTGALIGPEEVCAGPPGMIEEVLAAVGEQPPAPRDDGEDLAALIGPAWSELLSFGRNALLLRSTALIASLRQLALRARLTASGALHQARAAGVAADGHRAWLHYLNTLVIDQPPDALEAIIARLEATRAALDDEGASAELRDPRRWEEEIAWFFGSDSPTRADGVVLAQCLREERTLYRRVMASEVAANAALARPARDRALSRAEIAAYFGPTPGALVEEAAPVTLSFTPGAIRLRLDVGWAHRILELHD